jgi:hypothetical protein
MISYECIELKLSRQNPLQYTYKASINYIRKIIREKLDKNVNIVMFFDEGIYENYRYLNTKENQNDIIFIPFIHHSDLYYSKKRAISHFARYHIHFVKLNDTTTTVEIKTLQPKITIGESWFRKIWSEYPGFYNKEVPPTTIEEYKILLTIGEGLGVLEKMPKLILPDTTSYSINQFIRE